MEYRFDNFRLDPRSNSLYFEGKLIEGLGKKSVQILAVLIEKPREVVPHEEIISRVWGENHTGADSRRVAQYILKVRKVFSEIHPNENFISTAPNRGYAFNREVTVSTSPSGINCVTEAPVANGERGDEVVQSNYAVSSQSTGDTMQVAQVAQYAIRNVWSDRRWLPPSIATLVLLAVGYAWFSYFSAPEEEKVRQVVKDSQLYESLVLYRDPKVFSEENLDKYWTTEIDVNSNVDRKRIREGVRGLIAKGLHYGNETKCEQFEFQSVEIDVKNETALVKTLEKWFIAVYREDGALEKNKFVGPYFVSYVLRNIDGRWLVEKSSTARANLPTPRLIGIEPVTEIEAGKQMFVNLKGEQFLPQSLYLRVSGEGCPEANPCIVPNSALLKHSKFSETSLDNVPLTLASGDFLIYVHNSETQFSNPVSLTVP